jgi:hypothetical protein
MSNGQSDNRPSSRSLLAEQESAYREHSNSLSPTGRLPMSPQAIPDAYRVATPYLIVRGATDAIAVHNPMAVTDQFDGDRRGTVTDPFGHVWLLASRKEDISKEEMQRRFDAMMSQGAQ